MLGRRRNHHPSGRHRRPRSSARSKPPSHRALSALRALFFLCFLAGLAARPAAAAETMSFGRFGQVNLYRNAPHPKHVVLFLSGAGAWNADAQALAQALARLDALVIGVDFPYYSHRLERGDGDCLYPAGTLEMLSKLVQKKLDFPHYLTPVLVGYGTSGGFAYGALAQAPPGTFLGAISLGFCPDLDFDRPFCEGTALTSKSRPGGASTLQPTARLEQPWVAVSGPGDPLCPGAAQAFVRQVHGATYLALPAPPHGKSAAARTTEALRWRGPLERSLLRLENAADLARPPETATLHELHDLPLLELPVIQTPQTAPPAKASATGPAGKPGAAGAGTPPAAGAAGPGKAEGGGGASTGSPAGSTDGTAGGGAKGGAASGPAAPAGTGGPAAAAGQAAGAGGTGKAATGAGATGGTAAAAAGNAAPGNAAAGSKAPGAAPPAAGAATPTAGGGPSDWLAVIVSGDGGWAGLDRQVAGVLVDKGVPVVGLNTLQYLWTPRTPEGAAADLGRILRTYLPAWGRSKAILIGYSLGGEILPFMANRLPADLLAKVQLIALLGPTRTTGFEFRLQEWQGKGPGQNLSVLPEVAKLAGHPLVCLFGAGEKQESACPQIGAAGKAIEVPGAHYLGGDYRAIADRLLQEARPQPPPEPPPAAPARRHPPGQPGKPAPSGASGTSGAGGAAATGTKPGATATGQPAAAGQPAPKPPAPATPPPGAAPPPPITLAAAAWAGGGPPRPRPLLAVARGPAGRGGTARPPAQQRTGPVAADRFSFGRFGEMVLYHAQGTPPLNLVVFFSGEEGWTPASAELARSLASADTAVVGLDLTRYLGRAATRREGCLYPAGNLEVLSKAVQKRLGFAVYEPPALAGFGTGGALAYGALAQAPPNTFRGAVSLAFCQTASLSPPLCAGDAAAGASGGLALKGAPGPGKRVEMLPAGGLEQPWIALQGDKDRVCPASGVVEFARQVRGGEAEVLPGLGHDLASPAPWKQRLRGSVAKLARPALGAAGAAVGVSAAAGAGSEVTGSVALPGLPVIEMPGAAQDPSGHPGTLAVILSGDGGWAGVDRRLGKVLSGARGVPVVGFDLLQYLWPGRTPEEAAADLARILRHYLQAWHSSKVLLVGYSLGADVLPFLAARLPEDLARQVGLIVLIGPSHSTSLAIRIHEDKATELPVLPEVEKLANRPLLCVSGQGEADSLCNDLGPKLARRAALPGSHAFSGEVPAVADLILREAQAAETGSGTPSASHLH